MLLYYITDRKAFTGTETQQGEALLRRIAEAARAGVDYIQLREKDISARELERLAHQVVQAVRDNSAATKLLINGRSDIALAAGADGVHLPAGELAASEVRALWIQCRERNFLLGVSAHTIADVRSAEEQAADFAVLAPIFEKAQTGTPGIGVEALRAACAGSQSAGDKETPGRFAVLALGGVTLLNARACIEAGAAGVAGIRLFQQGDVFETVEQLRTVITKAS
jgi:thiamine-phosphate pyrophosphorylase